MLVWSIRVWIGNTGVKKEKSIRESAAMIFEMSVGSGIMHAGYMI